MSLKNCFFSLLLLVTVPAAAEPAAPSRLGQSASPYLRAHATDPVDWHEWGPDAFAKAKRLNRPIFVSVGYLACHWCHVMQAESFANPDTAAIMNRLYVNILVDRELRPDVDGMLIRAARNLDLPTGWPLNVFMTPDGVPVYAGVYFPPEPLRGYPGFPDVLEKAAAMLADLDPATRAQFRQVVSASGQVPGTVSPTPERMLDIADTLAAAADPLEGGFGPAPKFPQIPALDFLWRMGQRSGKADYREAVLTAMDHMVNGGLHDHLGGGFARYSIDNAWTVPHFEKMLNDNAMFLRLMTDIWKDTRAPRLEARIRDTAAFLLRDMRLPDGTFASALDADSEGEEGRFYLWEADDIDRLLGDRAAPFKAFYGVTALGQFELRNVLHLADPRASFADEQVFSVDRMILFNHRESRIRPQRDDKRLADWNGLAIAALAEAGTVFREAQWVDAAKTAFAVIMATADPAWHLPHSVHDGRSGRLNGALADQAAMALAALALHDATGDDLYLVQAMHLAQAAGFLWQEDRNRYRDTPIRAAGALEAEPLLWDNPEPAGNSAMAEVLTRLYHLTGTPHFETRARAIIADRLASAQDNPVSGGGILAAADLWLAAVQIVVVGPDDAPATRDMLHQVHTSPWPARVMKHLRPGQDLPRSHPAFGKTMIDGRATAYICVGSVCSLPVTDPAAMQDTAAALFRQGYAPAGTR